MENPDLLSLASLKESIRELVEALENAQQDVSSEGGIHVQDSRDLIMGELTMVVLLLTNVDSNVSACELELMNDMRRAVYGKGIPLLMRSKYEELCRQYLCLYPERKLSIDILPSTIRYLDAHDRVPGTECAARARALFFRFAEAMVIADGNRDPIESMLLMNF